MFERKILFSKLFSSFKIVGAIKDVSWRPFFLFLNGATSSFRGQSSLLITSTPRHNINKLIKHKICIMNLSFQKSKNMLSSIKIQAEKGKNL